MPGTTPKKLAKTCNLECQKGIFPFAKFTSRDYLAETELPTDAADWASDLNPTASPTQEEVNEALQQFKKWGCNNVGDYCAEYLRLDCEVTLGCALRLNEKFRSIVGLHPVSYGLWTVASLSNAAVQLDLHRRKKPAVRFANSYVIHSLLATTGLRGGLCMQLNSFGGKPPDVSDYVRQTNDLLEAGASPEQTTPFIDDYDGDMERYLRACNAFLGPGAHPADRVAALDVNSLYAAAQRNSSADLERPVPKARAHARAQARRLRRRAIRATLSTLDVLLCCA